MKPARFDYFRVETREEALAYLGEFGEDARLLAGGQSLMPMLNMRLATPTVIIDTSPLSASATISETGDTVVIEAGITQARLLDWPELRHALPLFAAALPWVGHAQTRSRGTICGSLAHADPSGEIPLCTAVLGGKIELARGRKIRHLTSETFHIGMMVTDRQPDEMLTRVTLPRARPNTGFAFREFGRRHGDFAIVACATKVTATSITFGVGGVSDTPALVHWDALEGSALDDALNIFAWELGARADLHADARMRRDLVRQMGRDVIMEARKSCNV